jgi:hypothetical protein
LQGTNAQAKHTPVKLAEEKTANRNSQESTKPSNSDSVHSEDGRYVGSIFIAFLSF